MTKIFDTLALIFTRRYVERYKRTRRVDQWEIVPVRRINLVLGCLIVSLGKPRYWKYGHNSSAHNVAYTAAYAAKACELPDFEWILQKGILFMYM